MYLLRKKTLLFLLSLPLVLVFAYACQGMKSQTRAAIKVSDQVMDANILIIDEVYIATPGWVIIHKDLNGGPGPMLGYAKVVAGFNKRVQVTINPEQTTLTLYVTLHMDKGIPDTLEFPGNDLPVQINGQTVTAVFHLRSSELYKNS